MPVRKPTAIAIRHVAFEDLGLLAPVLAPGGWEISYRDAPIDDLADPVIETTDLLIVLGSPIGVYEATNTRFWSQKSTSWSAAVGPHPLLPGTSTESSWVGTPNSHSTRPESKTALG
jgi:hypothetical protein